MVNLGLIAFANHSGLGAQTRRLAQMLKPYRILVIDSSGFSQNKELNIKPFYDIGTKVGVSKGFPDNEIILEFMEGLTHILTCENPYNFNMVYWAKQRGIKTYCQVNYEFCENLSKPWLPLPDKFIMPSYWKAEEMKLQFGEDKVIPYLPPPIHPDEFKIARETNLMRSGKKRFLHIVGTLAHKDRNGTLDLLEALKYSKGDYELVIKSQHQLPDEYHLLDHRITYEFNSPEKNSDLYKDFDALILPRRYAGLSLSTNEALMSALPVIMPDISPNNSWLLNDWLVEAELTDYFLARSLIGVYSVKHDHLGAKLDELALADLEDFKHMAVGLATGHFHPGMLLPEYEKLFTAS